MLNPVLCSAHHVLQLDGSAGGESGSHNAAATAADHHGTDSAGTQHAGVGGERATQGRQGSRQLCQEEDRHRGLQPTHNHSDHQTADPQGGEEERAGSTGEFGIYTLPFSLQKDQLTLG